MVTRIYTKSGDNGQTGLFNGDRVWKDDIRVECYGTVDELNAAIGLGASLSNIDDLQSLIHEIQSQLFELGADLANPAHKTRIEEDGAEIQFLETHLDRLSDSLPPLKNFILPGGTPAAAAFGLARTVCRRAERLCVTLRRKDPKTPLAVIIYLNRLGDLIFLLKRQSNIESGGQEMLWEAKKQ
jgi:cob(I)alamin adenosyltransferase